jgi:hypothetical protein
MLLRKKIKKARIKELSSCNADTFEYSRIKVAENGTH